METLKLIAVAVVWWLAGWTLGTWFITFLKWIT